MDSSEALAKGIYSVLTSYPCYEIVPEGATLPYILLGEESITTSDTKTYNRTKHLITVHSYSEGTSSLAAKQHRPSVQSPIETELVVGAHRIDFLRMVLMDSKKEIETDYTIFHWIVEYEITLIKE